MSLLFSDITHAYSNIPVLSDLNLEVKPGEITCLLGPSGGGKSTLLRLAAGLERVQAGRIEIDGDVYATPEKMESPERRPVGMMFQDSALFPHLSVAQNVAFGLHGWSKDKIQSRVRELLEWVGCAELGSRMPHQLSGGRTLRERRHHAAADVKGGGARGFEERQAHDSHGDPRPKRSHRNGGSGRGFGWGDDCPRGYSKGALRVSSWSNRRCAFR